MARKKTNQEENKEIIPQLCGKCIKPKKGPDYDESQKEFFCNCGRPRLFKDIKEFNKKLKDRWESHFEQKEVFYLVAKKDEHGNIIVNKRTGKIKKEEAVKVITIIKSTPTYTGLAIALGTSREILLGYEDRDDEFSYSLREYKEKLQSWVESQLHTKAYNGAKFVLSNNYTKWTDKSEVIQTNTVTINEEDLEDD